MLTTQMPFRPPGPGFASRGHLVPGRAVMPGPTGASRAGAGNDWLAHEAARRREVVVCGAHGGAGTTTLACWLGPAWDMGVMRPSRDPHHPAILARGRPLLLTCGNTPAAAAAVAALTRAGARVAVLAVVSDDWPQPATATARFRLLAPQAGAIVHVPFVPALRLADSPARVPLRRAVQRALHQIRALTGRPPTEPQGDQPRCRYSRSHWLCIT